MDAILFKKCLGLNDARAFGTQKMVTNPRSEEAGFVELTDCLNLTITPDGCLEKIPAMVTALTHTAPILSISAGSRFLFQDGVNTNEWLGGTSVVNRFPITDGPIVHTPIDCRVASATKVYKSVNPAVVMAEAVLGDLSAVPSTSKVFAAQPAFNHAFIYNAKLYGVNHADPRFLQYSEDYAYDLWNLGDGFISHASAVLQAGQIKGVMLTLHEGGVTVYAGTGPHDFKRDFYPCSCIDGTLYSGFISKVSGYGHVFTCADGVYLVGQDGALVNLTVDQTDNLGALNTSYSCATVSEGKYLAFGNALCIEYDFKTKTVLKRSSFGIKAATTWKDENYFAAGSAVVALGTEIDTGTIPADMTLPFSDLGASGTKVIECLHFTGEISGEVTITVTDQAERSWSVEVADIGRVAGFRIKTPKGRLGNHIQFKINVASGAFRIEELRAVLTATTRSR